MGKTYSLELQVECKNSSGKSIVIMVLFKIDPKGETTSHFLKEIGIGNGQIKQMGINKEKEVNFKHKKALQNLIDHFFYVSYKGQSLYGNSCDSSASNVEYFLITETIKISQ